MEDVLTMTPKGEFKNEATEAEPIYSPSTAHCKQTAVEAVHSSPFIGNSNLNLLLYRDGHNCSSANLIQKSCALADDSPYVPPAQIGNPANTRLKDVRSSCAPQ
jgi:hypothetical protein